MTRFGRRNNTVVTNSCGCRGARVCGMQVPMLQSLSLRACLCFPPPLCEWCLPHSIQPAWIWQHRCFMWCKLVCGASQKIHIVPCYCKSTPACALLLLFGCLKAVKWPVFHASANELGVSLPWMHIFRNSVYAGRRKETGMVRVKFLSTLRSHQLLWSRRGFLLAAPRGTAAARVWESGDQLLPLYPSVVFQWD